MPDLNLGLDDYAVITVTTGRGTDPMTKRPAVVVQMRAEDVGRPMGATADGYHLTETLPPGDATLGSLLEAVKRACETISARAQSGDPYARS